MKYIVINQTGQHWLKSTIWTSAKETATRFESREDAVQALARAAMFNKKGAKNASIVPDAAV